MNGPTGCVVVVDDDEGIRDALQGLFRSVGLAVRLHGSVAEFLAAAPPQRPCCLVLDVRLPGRGGLDLQAELVAQRRPLPVVFITAHGDIPMTVSAMKAGAVEFLTKPFRDQDLLDAVQVGLERDMAALDSERADAGLVARYDELTPREQQVFALVATGRLNKQIAADMGVAEITVKVHRSQMMRKMGARNVVELARMADRLRAHGDP